MRSVRAQALSSPMMDIIGYVAIALLLWVGRNQIKSDERIFRRPVRGFHHRGLQALRSSS